MYCNHEDKENFGVVHFQVLQKSDKVEKPAQPSHESRGKEHL